MRNFALLSLLYLLKSAKSPLDAENVIRWVDDEKHFDDVLECGLMHSCHKETLGQGFISFRLNYFTGVKIYYDRVEFSGMTLEFTDTDFENLDLEHQGLPTHCKATWFFEELGSELLPVYEGHQPQD